MTPAKVTSVHPTKKATWTYHAFVRRVIDGDTIDLLVDVGFDCAAKVRIRVAGVNTPEIRGEERSAGLESKALVETWLPEGAPVIVRSYKGARSFSRWVGDVFFDYKDGAGVTRQYDLAKALIEAGAGDPA